MFFNVNMIRAESISPELVAIVREGQAAFVRMKERYERGLGLGFDGPGLLAIGEAMTACEAITDASSPAQMKAAIREAYRRITDGQLLEVAA